MIQMLDFISHVHPTAIPHLKCLRHSLCEHEPHHQHFVVTWGCRDEISEFYAKDSRVIIVSSGELEQECRLLGIDWGALRGTRSDRDLAWTAQACLPYWLMADFDIGQAIYLDNDLYFWQPLQPILDLFPEAHVGVCKHHYPPGRENVSAGIYNNGLVWWRNTPLAREHAKRWALETIERWNPSHPRRVDHEQKLLDEWPEQLGEALAVLPPEVNWGAWRRSCVRNTTQGPMIAVVDSATCDFKEPFADVEFHLEPLQSAHMHEFRRTTRQNPIQLKGEHWGRSGYELHPETIEAVYKPYEQMMETFL